MLIDLTEKWHELRDKTPSVEDAWREYRRQAPELFDDYEHYWGAAPTWESVELSRAECSQRVQAIEKTYSNVGALLARAVDFKGALPDLYAIIGSARGSGHAVSIAQRFAAWVDVTAFTTPQQIEVFVTHELAHAIHYSVSPTTHYSLEAFHLVIRKLWTEGVATYLTMRTLDCTPQEALWADFLSREELERWMARCSQNEGQLWAELKKQAWQVDPRDGFFTVDERRPLEEWRTGYFCGVKLASRIASEVGIAAMLSLSLREVGRYLERCCSAR